MTTEADRAPPRLHVRDAKTAVVDLGNGRAEAILNVLPTHYRAEDGSWRAVSNRIVEREDGGWENTTNTLRSHFPADSGMPVAVDHREGGRIEFVGRSMSWCDSRGACERAAGHAPTAADAHRGDTGHLVYPDVYPGVDEEFRVLAVGIKHDVVLKVPPLPPRDFDAKGYLSFSWEVRADGLQPLANGQPLAGEDFTQRAIRFQSGSGASPMAIAAPRIVAAPGEDPHHAASTMGIFRITPKGDHHVLELWAAVDWLRAPERRYPVRIDPTVVVQPQANGETGFISHSAVHGYDRGEGRIVSGTVAALDPRWEDVEGYARFSTATIADCIAQVDSIELSVWLSNHDNYFDPTTPLAMDVLGCSLDPNAATDAQLFDAIRDGPTYASDVIPATGDLWCAYSYEHRAYDLGTGAAADLQAQLSERWFAIGFRSEIDTDPVFDHIDYIGYPEEVPGACGLEPLPDSRISLRVTGTAKNPPVADAGGPYVTECAGAETAVDLDGSASSAPDGGWLTFSWTTDCRGGTFDDASAPNPRLAIASPEGCGASCSATLEVSNGCASASETVSIELTDTTSPSIAPGPLSGSCLWSPNHKYVCMAGLAALATATDDCSTPTLTATACSSDQPDEAPDPGFPGENGDGHTHDDCAIAPDGKTLCVRAERLGTDETGRNYAVTLVADDGCSEPVAFEAGFFVAHDQRAPRQECLNVKESELLESQGELPWLSP